MKNVAIVAAICAIIAGDIAKGVPRSAGRLAEGRPRIFGHRQKSDVTLEQIVKQDANKNYILYVGAPWCHYCVKLKPTIDSLKRDYIVHEINADQHPVIVKKLGVRGLPTVIVMDKGKEVARYVGGGSRETLTNGVKTRQAQTNQYPTR